MYDWQSKGPIKLTRNFICAKSYQRLTVIHARTHAMGSLGDSCAAEQPQQSILFAFDFDHTIVDGNTDTHVIKAHPNGRLPSELKQSYQPGRWTEYMQRVLAHLHQQGVSVADMQQVMEQLPYTPGMQELLQALQTGSILGGQPCSCIILSDSNSEFIDWILTSRGHQAAFSRIYTNPATLTAGGLLVSPFHSHECAVCPVNMCKRSILQQHQQMFAGTHVPKVVYVGDGSNDLCPAQSLGPADVVMVRAGFALDKLLQDPIIAATVQAHVHRWSDASEILQVLEQL